MKPESGPFELIGGSFDASPSVEDSASNVRRSSSTGNVNETSVGQVLRKPKVDSRHESTIVSVLGGSVALLFVICLLAKDKKLIRVPKEQGHTAVGADESFSGATEIEDSAQDGAAYTTFGIPMEDAQERLNTLENLLPLAARLASAISLSEVHSSEAKRLLETLQQNVKPRGKAEEGVEDRDTMQVRLDCALDALRRLHRAALHAGGALVSRDADIHAVVFPVSYEQHEDLSLLLQEDNAEPVQTFLKYLRPAEQDVRDLSQRLSDIHMGLSLEPQLKDENDGELLLSVTKKIEQMHSLVERRRRSIRRADMLRLGAAYAVKLVLLNAVEESIWRLQGTFEVAQAHASLVFNRHSVSSHSDHQAESPVGDRERANLLMNKLDDMETLQKKLGREMKALISSISTDAAIAAYGRAAKLTEEGWALLAHCWALAKELDIHSSKLDDVDPAVIVPTANKIWSRAKAKLISIDKALDSVREKCSDTLSSSATTPGGRHLNTRMTARLLEAADAIVREASKQSKRFKAFKQPEEVTELIEDLDSLNRAEEDLIQLVGLNRDVLLLLMAYKLQDVVEDDIEECQRTVVGLCAHKSSLSDQHKSVLIELEESFNRSLKAVEEAETFKEAAAAATLLWEHAGAVEDFLLDVGMEKN
ncbi:hypothetical protein, conserved [Eimeria maxima]|uniref:Uncharacterized protein n=1 Tax=Eimeria maxima TaxID=5804 RepID=U6ME20_EIMMA|nr:hypothetical protein, conserved [Eimeria maxima]CDJ59920.1 hypothetical protein, conserved [Eimeria maxima]